MSECVLNDFHIHSGFTHSCGKCMSERMTANDACVGYARKNKLFPEEKMVCTKTLYNEVWGGNLSLNILELRSNKTEKAS